MATLAAVTEDVEEIIQDVIAKYKLDPNSDITYGEGSAVGDGYMSRTISVDIENNGKSVCLFLKCALNMKVPTPMPIEMIYENEIYFYDVVNPAFVEFMNDRGVEGGLQNVPKCYGTSTKNILALENLRKRGYTMFDNEKMMNDKHIVLVLKAYAKYHAISLGFKDQQREEFDALCDEIQDIFTNPNMQIDLMQQMQKQMINDCIAQWDPVEDKETIKRVENLADKIGPQVMSAMNVKNEYTVITKGDCWSNNMMFLYEEENETDPTDVMLVDWQIIRVGSLVLDLAYFFYTVASKEVLSNLNHYLKVYHEELSNQIRQLGSDPDVLYPYSVLEEEWNTRCVYGYMMSFMIIRAMLIPKEEAPSFEDMDFNNMEGKKMFDFKNTEEYARRTRDLTEHMLENGYLNFL